MTVNCDVAQDQTINKKPKNKKQKKESVTGKELIEVVPESAVNENVINKKKAKSSTNSLPKEDEVSVKTDSGIAEDAKPKKSKSKKQKEKKAAAAAAIVAATAAVSTTATPTLQQSKTEMSAKSVNKELGNNDKIVIDITTKPKDKKKKPKKDSSINTEQKLKDEKVKVLERLWFWEL